MKISTIFRVLYATKTSIKYRSPWTFYVHKILIRKHNKREENYF